MQCNRAFGSAVPSAMRYAVGCNCGIHVHAVYMQFTCSAILRLAVQCNF